MIIILHVRESFILRKFTREKKGKHNKLENSIEEVSRKMADFFVISAAINLGYIPEGTTATL